MATWANVGVNVASTLVGGERPTDQVQSVIEVSPIRLYGFVPVLRDDFRRYDVVVGHR